MKHREKTMKNEANNQIDKPVGVITFISQVFAAGVLATCLFILSALISGWHRDVYVLIFVLPPLVLLSLPLTAFIGGLIGLVAPIYSELPGRLAVGWTVAYAIGLWFESIFSPEPFLSPIEFAICFGTPTAFLVVSKIRPWKVFTFGTVTINNGYRTSRETSSNVFALLGSLPLRVLNIYLLVLTILIEATLARDFYSDFKWERSQSIAAAIAIFIIFYLISGIYLSYSTPRTSVLVALVILFNTPTIGFAIWLYSKRTNGIEGPGFLVAAIILMEYLMLWALCLASRISATKLIRRQIQLAQFAVVNEHHCLGERMAFWQQECAVEFGGTK
jgi:hypothetical protein